MKTILVCLFVFIVSVAPGSAQSPCSKPGKGLKLGPNIDGQRFHFDYRAAQYPMEIFSGFSLQDGRQDYCIRYEAVNRGGADIEMFHWPLAGITLKRLVANDPQSILISIGPGLSPTLDKTTLHAFIKSTVDSLAYRSKAQKQASGPSANFNGGGSSQVEGTEETQFRTIFPPVGIDFAGSGASFILSSHAFSDGKITEISTVVTRKNEMSEDRFRAPFLYALEKGKSAESLTTIAVEARNTILPLKDGTYSAKAFFPPTKSLFVVHHPVVFDTKYGAVCVLAPSYSQFELPGKALDCPEL